MSVKALSRWLAAGLHCDAIMLENAGAGIEHYMNLVSARQKVVASNIANADTPGYKTKDIDFQTELQSQMSAASKPNVIEVSGLKNKNDGNNVDMDREARLLAENALRFSRRRQPGAFRAQHHPQPPLKREARVREPLFEHSRSALREWRRSARAAEVLVENLANSETTRTPEGGPYRRKDVVFEEDPSVGSFSSEFEFRAGVQPFRRGGQPRPPSTTARPSCATMPGHPDADKDGYVAYPENQSGRGHGGSDGRLARL